MIDARLPDRSATRQRSEDPQLLHFALLSRRSITVGGSAGVPGRCSVPSVFGAPGGEAAPVLTCVDGPMRINRHRNCLCQQTGQRYGVITDASHHSNMFETSERYSSVELHFAQA